MSAYPKYLQMNVGAPVRLARLRAINPDNWRKARRWTFGNAHAACCDEMNPGFNGEGRSRSRIWYTFTRQYFREERAAGFAWYCDPNQETTAQGIIARLPHGKFLAGYCLTESGECVWFDATHDDENEAARMASEHARVISEQEMEYQTRWQQARELEDKILTSLTRLRECLVLRHNECMAYTRAEVAGLVRTIRKARESLATDYKDVAE